MVCIRVYLLIEEKRMTSIGHKDLFEILASVEDYIANETLSGKGSDLLSKAMHSRNPNQFGSVLQNWRDMIPGEYSASDLVGLFRLKATHIIAYLYTTN
jgi:hypothetical protein